MTTRTQQPLITRVAETEGSGFSKVFAFLRDRLLEGSIQSGDRLIPERELAAQLGVSRPIVREALRALSMMGVVEIRERVGTVVRKPDVSVLGDFFAFSMAQQADIVDDVMQARIAIEVQAARLACRHATTSDLERIAAAVDHIEATVNDSEEGSRADYEFHSALVRASRSETLVQLYAAMSTLLLRSHHERRDVVGGDPAIKQYLVEDHARIFQALIARDEDRADQVLRKHFSIGDEYRRKAAADPAARGRPPERKELA
ncbi:FadR/GntR family transcriptional regulator [Variovorax ureilyticus]|uniref:FadR/GntR family transcriptional regulator n=1 Tax=Variovorax ureilyticus TaxID=1836198 RepID=A0ABU8VND2_9BURK